MIRGLVAVAGVLALTAGCTEPGSKSGGDLPLTTLKLGTSDPQGPRPGARAVEEFARQVKALSDGRLAIEPVWDANQDGPRDWDQQVARQVVKGNLDLAMVPARAWDTEGVTTFRALHAPLLVDSDQLSEAIVGGPLAGELTAGLDQVGVVPLVLMHEGLRHPFAFDGRRLTAPKDYAGGGVRVPRSDVSYALFRALGATPDDWNSDEFANGVASGSIIGTESSFSVAPSSLPDRAVVTGNVTFYPKVNALVGNRARLDRLTERQRKILRDAATRVRDTMSRDSKDDPALAREYCASGGAAVDASQADLRALEAAVQPVYAELARDAATKSLIDRIRAEKQKLGPPPAVEPCGTPQDGDPGQAGAAGPPEGTYRTATLTREQLIKAGITAGMTPAQAETVVRGIASFPVAYVMKFEAGHWVQSETADGRTSLGSNGTYTADAHTLKISEPCCGETVFDYTLSGDALTLRFKDADPRNCQADGDCLGGFLVFESAPFVRVRG
jgi:TRAP-type C4-dicarboxylate transport system substrate-binding protein